MPISKLGSNHVEVFCKIGVYKNVTKTNTTVIKANFFTYFLKIEVFCKIGVYKNVTKTNTTVIKANLFTYCNI